MKHTSSLVAAAAAAVAITSLPAQGAAWTLQPTGATPPARWQHAMSYDLLRGQVVVFGGRWTTNYNADTWEFDGTSWTQRSPANSPPGRYLGAMCYHWQTGQTVLFGGNTLGAGDETWLWDGVDWSLAQPATSPPIRRQQAMAYDTARNVVVMFGGQFSGGTRTDTWEWDGVDWTQVPTTANPPSRSTRMAFDAVRGVMVVFGGEITTANYHAETWEYDGTDWTQRFPPNSPSARVAAAIEYDPNRLRTVVYGGFDNSLNNLGDTWEYDGYDWYPVATAPAPTDRRDFDNTVFDLVNGRVVMFGGYTNNGVTDETWTFVGDRAGSFTVYGPDCPPPGGAITFSGTTPTIGQSFDLAYGNLGGATGVVTAFGVSDVAWSGGPLPANLSAIGLPGCDLRTGADVQTLSLQSGGAATFGWTLPSSTSIYGATFFCQGFTFDLGAGLAFTGGTGLGRARVGN